MRVKNEAFVSELESLSDAYRQLESEWTTTACADPSAELVEALLKKSDLFSRISQMEQGILQLAAQWEQHPENELHSTSEIRSRAAALGGQGRKLGLLCEERIRFLGLVLQRIEQELAEVQKGTRYLESQKPAKTNFPKFLDSLG